MKSTRLILLADDHVIIRRGLKVLMANHFHQSQFIEADTTHEVLKALKEHPITHMILDMQLHDTNIIEILSLLRTSYPDIPILIYSMNAEEVFGGMMLQYGISGFLSKQSNEDEVVKALNSFFNGRPYISDHLHDVLNDRKLNDDNPLNALSEREISVMGRLLKGESVKDISTSMNLKATTVATYKARIFEKLAVNNIMELRNLADAYQFRIQ